MSLPQENARRIQLSQVATPAFLVAVVLLLAAMVLNGPVATWLQLKQVKKALPLKLSLDAFDERAIAPYRVKARHVLEPTVVEALDTDVYINWTLEDSSVPPNDPLREVNLFVTYYTGGRSLVPHTPDVCYLGGGYTPTQRHETAEIGVTFGDSGPSKVPIRVCTFGRTAVFDERKLSVVYTFDCNGRFVATRTDVRMLINDPRNTYAYFSKVEACFPAATRAQTVEGTRKLFARVLPVLVRDHFPDFGIQEEAACAEAADERKSR